MGTAIYGASETRSRASLEAMAEEQWAVTVTLGSGETRVLASSAGALEVAKNNLDAFLNKRAPFGSDWVAAERSWVARAHIVEATVTPLEGRSKFTGRASRPTRGDGRGRR